MRISVWAKITETRLNPNTDLDEFAHELDFEYNTFLLLTPLPLLLWRRRLLFVATDFVILWRSLILDLLVILSLWRQRLLTFLLLWLLTLLRRERLMEESDFSLSCEEICEATGKNELASLHTTFSSLPPPPPPPPSPPWRVLILKTEAVVWTRLLLSVIVLLRHWPNTSLMFSLISLANCIFFLTKKIFKFSIRFFNKIKKRKSNRASQIRRKNKLKNSLFSHIIFLTNKLENKSWHLWHNLNLSSKKTC